MRSFEQELRRRILVRTLYAICIGLIVIVTFVLKGFVLGTIQSLDGWDVGILAGLFLGAEISACLRIAQLRKALKNPALLEAFHIKEKDERNRMLVLKTSRSCVGMTILLLSLGGIVASFFSRTVFLTIGIILIGVLVLYVLLGVYYSRKI